MTGGDFTPVVPRCCCVCGFRGEWSGFLRPCKACEKRGEA